MQLHLSCNPLAVEMRVPIAPLIWSHIITAIRGGFCEWYPEVTLSARGRSLFQPGTQNRLSCCISHLRYIQNDQLMSIITSLTEITNRLRNSLMFIEYRSLFVASFPSMVDFKAAMELFPTRLDNSELYSRKTLSKT